MTIHLFKGKTCIDARNPSRTKEEAVAKARNIMNLDLTLGVRSTILVVDTASQTVLAEVKPS